MFIRVSGILRVNFETKNAPRSSRRVLGVWSHGPAGCKIGSLCLPFPVWRELKLNFSNFRRDRLGFACPFPFEGNWNFRCTGSRRTSLLSVFACPFPFEGNWNSFLPDSVTFPERLCLPFPVWRELKLLDAFLNIRDFFVIFVCPFPFEGNWNANTATKKVKLFTILCLPFPVWRELKQNKDR